MKKKRGNTQEGKAQHQSSMSSEPRDSAIAFTTAVQVRLATLRNGCDPSEAAFQFSLALEDEVLQVLTDQSLSGLQDIVQLTEAL